MYIDFLFNGYLIGIYKNFNKYKWFNFIFFKSHLKKLCVVAYLIHLYKLRDHSLHGDTNSLGFHGDDDDPLLQNTAKHKQLAFENMPYIMTYTCVIGIKTRQLGRPRSPANRFRS